MKCAVITPVGPGHAELYALCRQSVEQAFAQHPGPFAAIELLAMDDGAGLHGRSARRNDGIALAREKGCEWLFFLDADDLMAGQAFEVCGRYAADHDAIWGMICENVFGSPMMQLRPGQPRELSTMAGLLRHDPALTLQMGHFVRTEVAAAVGFDPAMDAGEDFRYYLGLWQSARCRKVPEVLFVNRRGRHSKGPRSADGAQWRRAVQQVMQEHARNHPVVAEVLEDGVAARFAVDNPADIIQAHHLAGGFFETTELRALRDHVPPGATIADIGSNVGNHLVYFAQHLAPRRIIAVEPGERAIGLLRRNIALNGIDCADTSLLGIGAGERFGQFALDVHQPDNLGASRLQPSRRGTVKVYPLDVRIRERVDFLKIDVEGMEMQVLAGARKLIGQCRPGIFIEILNGNLQAFGDWLQLNRYRVQQEWRYVNSMNYLAVPA